MGKPLTKEQIEEICNTYLRVRSYEETAILTRHKCSTVCKYIKLNGLNVGIGGNQERQKKITDEELLEAVKTMTTQEIAEKWSIHETTVLRRCKKLGIKPLGSGDQLSGLRVNWGKHNDNLSENKSIGLGNTWHYIASHDELIKKKHPDMIYLESRQQRIRLMCKDCRTVNERAASTVRQGAIVCEHCLEQQKKENELLQERIKLMRFFVALKEYKTPKKCACCGKDFYSPHYLIAYCSEKCKAKAKRMRYKERHPEAHAKKRSLNHYRKRAEKYGCSYEHGITRIKVIKRDNYICQICGKVCNPEDKRWGSFGPDYPTLDHIIPLAKGGPHSWDNVQCACGECNSTKRDLYTVKREEVWT